MASNQCIIDDEYCKSMGSYFKKQGEALDKMISDYIDVLETVKNTAIKDGDVAKALDSFIEYAKQMKGKIGVISNSAQVQVTNFLSKVDEADQYLF